MGLIDALYFELCHPFTVAPRLVELDLPDWLGGWVFPWSQLTKVNIPVTDEGFVHSKKFEAIVSQLQTVEELRVGQIAFWPTTDIRDKCSSSPIRLAPLRLLEVPIYPPERLTRLEAPLLEHLWVDRCATYEYMMSDTIRLSLLKNYHVLSIVRHATFADCHCITLIVDCCLIL